MEKMKERFDAVVEEASDLISSGKDVYICLAQKLLGIPYENVTAVDREKMKRFCEAIHDVQSITAKQGAISKDTEESKEILYAAGYSQSDGDYGMFYGPNPSLDDVLLYACPAYDRPAYVVELTDKEEGHTPLYKWNFESCAWDALFSERGE